MIKGKYCGSRCRPEGQGECRGKRTRVCVCMNALASHVQHFMQSSNRVFPFQVFMNVGTHVQQKSIQ
eukprot:356598-Pelagomonas_calceolata.AAC.5